MHQLNDPWTQILNDFFKMDKTEIALYPKGKNWTIKIVASGNPQIYNWANSILSKWNNVKLIHEQWGDEQYEFENLREAEKFITLFNLTWAQ